MHSARIVGEVLTLKQFLVALRTPHLPPLGCLLLTPSVAGHTALHLVTNESEERGVGYFGRTTVAHRQQLERLEADPVHALGALLGRLQVRPCALLTAFRRGLTAGLLGSQRSQGVPKMKRQTGRTVEVNFKGAHSHEKETKQVRTPALAPILSAVC